MKVLRIFDESTGEIEEEVTFSGGYHIIYTNLYDAGYLRYIKKLDSAKFGDNHWIKNYIYRPIAIKLTKKFPEIKHVKPSKILFIEDMEWEKPSSIKPKKHWMAKMSMANKQFSAMTGYEYVLETRNYYIERMSREQIVALIYHELMHIDKFGDIQSHDVEDWSNMVATLGKDWATTEGNIKNLIEDEIIWTDLEPVAKQLDIFGLRAIK